MKKVYLILAATVGMTITSCTTNDFIGEVATTPEEVVNDGSIRFGGNFKALTRADKVGADAADLLGGKFVVLGVKGDGTGVDQTVVFPNYQVAWTQNTAGQTESNTSDWEYVGVSPISGITGVTSQTIKYWDYSATAYDFAAYSAGKGNAIVTTTPISNQIKASAISYATSAPTTTTYTLKGSRADLTECYITDMLTVEPENYGKEVVFNFRSLASKVRVALYETVPGYSVANVKFHSADVTRPITPAISGDATLIGSAFYTGGEYTVSFPHIGSTNKSTSSDYDKAHVEMTSADGTETTQTFGNLNYGGVEDAEVTTTYTQFLKRSSTDPSFAGSSTYYQTVLPKEDGTVLELCVDYTLVPIDGAAETITIYGAKAYVPAAYTKWLPNYAYTYIFKISDNTNGWTKSTAGTDPAGLFPITFDAVVLDSEETGHQTTITTVAEPSITTYQKGHVYDATNSYDKAKSIYVQVMQNGSLVTNLKATNKSFFYKLSADKTEAEVMDALNIRTSGSAPTVVGRNGLTLTPITSATPAGTESYTIEAVPGEDGNNIEVNSGEAGELNTGGGAGTYAYVYDYTTGDPAATEFVSAVVLTTEPDDWDPSDANVYYTYNYSTDTYDKVTTAYVDGTYYKKYTNRNHTYAVKVIKVQ